jgi:hypothetical protein
MVKEQAGKWVVPNPQIPRSFGLMNIIFGVFLLLVAIGYGLTYIYGPTIQKQFQIPIQKAQEQVKAEHAAKIAELKRQEAAAKTAEEKQTLADERSAAEKRGVPDFSAFQDIQDLNDYNEPRLAIFHILELSASVVLNVLLIVAGGGLLALAEWGRRLSIWVAKLKILRWIAMVIAMLVVIVPLALERTQKAMAIFESQIKAAGGANALGFSLTATTRYLTMFGAIFMVFAGIVASIYPAMAWWYLSRPASRAACMKRQSKPELPEADPQWETTV